MPNPPCGVLLVGHGTRDTRGLAEFFALVRLVKEQLDGLPMTPCFLEIAQPGIEEGVARLVSMGVCRIVVAPLMLFAAGHVRRDIPAAVQKAVARHVGVEVEFCPHLGNSPSLVELSARRHRETLVDGTEDDALLLLVGRGSHDAGASDEMGHFVELRQSQTGGRVEACFYAMAEPLLRDVLPALCEAERRIVVQPHLLFHGRLYDGIVETVEDCRRATGVELLVAEPLGPAPLLAAAVVEPIWGTTHPGKRKEY
jgi:sirohydrochlorin cobaltochelatase